MFWHQINEFWITRLCCDSFVAVCLFPTELSSMCEVKKPKTGEYVTGFGLYLVGGGCEEWKKWRQDSGMKCVYFSQEKKPFFLYDLLLKFLKNWSCWSCSPFCNVSITLATVLKMAHIALLLGQFKISLFSKKKKRFLLLDVFTYFVHVFTWYWWLLEHKFMLWQFLLQFVCFPQNYHPYVKLEAENRWICDWIWTIFSRGYTESVFGGSCNEFSKSTFFCRFFGF